MNEKKKKVSVHIEKITIVQYDLYIFFCLFFNDYSHDVHIAMQNEMVYWYISHNQHSEYP